ncbi:MAG: shikimate kinase [Candidatus Omnitrophota bacterium]|jgi:shikimate kinase
MSITLIGMAGVGKSFIGKELARRLSFDFIDTDKIIENKLGKKLQKIIDVFGEEKFLRIEEKTIIGLKLTDSCVIATGGSAVYSRKAMASLKKRSFIVFLDAPISTISTWIPDKDTRGIINLKKGLGMLYKERSPLYKKYAGLKIRLYPGYDKSRIVEEIIKKCRSRGLL